MDQYFETRQLPDAPDAIAPDGSQVRVLLRLGGGSMAHFELAAGQVSRAVAHHAVDELWYILAGHGQMWRRQGERQQTVPLRPGTCLSIPAGTRFQFRAGDGGPLARADLRRADHLGEPPGHVLERDLSPSCRRHGRWASQSRSSIPPRPWRRNQVWRS